MPAKKTKKPARAAAKKKTTISVKKNVGKSNVVVGNKNQVNLIVNEYAYSLDKKSQMDLKRQIEEYLDWVQESFGTIVLRGIERGGEQVVNVPLETMYVPLQAELQTFDDEHNLEKKNISLKGATRKKLMGVTLDDVRSAYSRKITLSEILSFGNRLIVTGGPGSGKTTVLLHLARTLAAALRGSPKLAKQKLGLKTALPLPIYVPLTRYADYLRKLPSSANADRYSLKTYISEYLNERGTNLEMLSPDFLNYLLRDGNTVLLLLDGLDEVPNEDERALIRSRIEDLVTGKKNLRVVVTSRTAAYQGQAVLGRDFQHIHVLPLDEPQIEKLIRQAYQSIYPKSETKARQQANDLLSNIGQLEQERRRRLGDNVKSLVDAPIMIRMLLIVHYNDRKLPDQRADLYQKAVDVVLRPDNAPDQRVTDEIEKRVGGSLAMNREMLQHLAFHMHKEGNEQGREIEEIGLRKIFQSEPLYKPFVDELISQTRQRGTLLEERGGLYCFIHLSFQEFLAGRYLAQNYSDPDQFVTFLEKGLCTDPWWREPILLAIGYQDMNAPIQARRILLRMAELDGKTKRNPKNSLDLSLASSELATIAYLECKSQSPDLGELLMTRLKELHKRSQSEKWTPAILASAMDGLDRLGYIPEDLYKFIPVSNFAISKYPITNSQYERFLKPENFQNKDLWINFPKCDEKSEDMKETWGDEPWDWLNKRYEFKDGILPPRDWRDPRFGVNRRHAPVVGISWYEANAYCNWLLQNWDALEEGKQDLPKPKWIRLPVETEWVIAAGGEDSQRFAFGELNDPKKEISSYANTVVSGIGLTTPVWMYPQGKSLSGALDMSGNVWEWQANYRDVKNGYLGLRGGSWGSSVDGSRVSIRSFSYFSRPSYISDRVGFRLVVSLLNE